MFNINRCVFRSLLCIAFCAILNVNADSKEDVITTSVLGDKYNTMPKYSSYGDDHKYENRYDNAENNKGGYDTQHYTSYKAGDSYNTDYHKTDYPENSYNDGDIYYGPRGERGSSGSIGRNGPRGERGSSGSISINGPQGERGSQGSIGRRGERGFNGAAGLRGRTGQPGEKGVAGVGKDGQDGSAGSPGQPGSPGSAGSPGQPGNSGQPGSPGQHGATGPAGPAGSPGHSVQGRVGPQGERGLRGPEGPRGHSGNSVFICNNNVIDSQRKYCEKYVLKEYPLTVLYVCELRVNKLHGCHKSSRDNDNYYKDNYVKGSDQNY